jgi:hypothetical protein
MLNSLLTGSQRLFLFGVFWIFPRGNTVSRTITNASTAGDRNAKIPLLRHAPPFPFGLLVHFGLLKLVVFFQVEARPRTSPDFCFLSFPVGQDLVREQMLGRFPA